MRSYIAILTCAAALAACGVATAPDTPPAAVMLGEWTHQGTSADSGATSLNAGLLVTIVIDSADGTSFRGHVGRWFAGDVGVPPGTFGPVTGSVDGRGGVTIVIASAATDMPPLIIRGALAVDVVTVSDCTAGSEPGPFPAGDRFQRAPRAHS